MVDACVNGREVLTAKTRQKFVGFYWEWTNIYQLMKLRAFD